MDKLWCSKCHTCWTEAILLMNQKCPFRDCAGILTPHAPVPPTPKLSVGPKRYEILNAIDVIDCANGKHGTLLDSEPIDYGGAVNVDVSCSVCGLRVSTTSWTRDAWEKAQAKAQTKAQTKAQAKAAARKQTDLFEEATP